MEKTAGNSYILSLRINSDGFSLLINDESGLLISTQNISTALFNLSTEEIIKIISVETPYYYKKVNIICESDSYIFIPTPFFKREEAMDFLYFQHKKVKNERVIYNYVSDWDTVNVFSIPSTLEQALARLFPESIIEHQLSWLLKNKIKPLQANSLSIWVRPKMMDVVALKNGKLQLLNSFSYQTPEDFTYHALDIIEQLSLDIEKCDVFLYNSEKKPELGKILEKYAKVSSL
ncbi:MAG TPA: DUF3822 family protein [Paludibacter sp.]|nr:DUF3822 family protein [Paludibacter sp.]